VIVHGARADRHRFPSLAFEPLVPLGRESPRTEISVYSLAFGKKPDEDCSTTLELGIT
jgi:hypothetical protein